MQTDVDVIIAGGGPVGLALAADLARWGVKFRIFDKKAEPEQYSKAANFWPRTQEVAVAMGFGQQVIAASIPIHTQTQYVFGSFAGQLRSIRRVTPFPDILAADQAHIERIISDHLAAQGYKVERSASVVGLNQTVDGVTAIVKYEDGRQEEIRAAYLVGCDGSKSAVRDMAGLTIEPQRVPGQALQQIDARIRWSRSTQLNNLWFWLIEGAFIGIVGLPGGHFRIFMGGDERIVPDRMPTIEETQTLLRRVTHDPHVELSDPVWFTHGRLAYGVARAYRQGRIFLAGDAGHITIPVGGQGMNNGIQDAFNLGWKLAAVIQGRAAAPLLDSYDRERRPVREALADTQAANLRRLAATPLWQKLLLRAMGSRIQRFQQSIELGGRDDTQLSINYPNSPLNEDHLRGGIGAGERAPDTATLVRWPSLTPVRSYDLIYSNGWTLLAFDAGRSGARAKASRIVDRISSKWAEVEAYLVLAQQDAPSQVQEGERVLFDLDRLAHQSFRIARPSLYLIRPDGYIAFRGNLNNEAAITAYCQRIFGL